MVLHKSRQKQQQQHGRSGRVEGGGGRGGGVLIGFVLGVAVCILLYALVPPVVPVGAPPERRRMAEAAFSHPPWQYRYLLTIAAIALCLTVAALAAGLTLGLLGLDPLLLLIKERAAPTEAERQMAQQLLPIVRQHHRLLVTLLLLNAVANEALPLFLESLVPPAVAVVLSVTLVVFFGEILPAAVFTGPHQLTLAHALLPLVRLVLWLLYPLAGPLAALLDALLPAPLDDASYTRSELAALIRIQYEERVAWQRKQKAPRVVGAGDFTGRSRHRPSVRALVQHLERGGDPGGNLLLPPPMRLPLPGGRESSHSGCDSHNRDDDVRWQDHSIHRDEVTMMEGALQMQTKVALDVFTPKRRVFSIPSTMKLDERNIVKIYASGYSRIPVHLFQQPAAIIGILVTKHLIVVDPQECRPVSTLPLRTPRCVSPAMPLVDLLNLFQSGGHASRGGHLALVCARPSLGERAFESSAAVLPEEAGYMGIITLEDVLEMLLQEQIYDEMDKRERKALKVIVQALGRWRRHLQRRGEERRNHSPNEASETSLLLGGTTTTSSSSYYASSPPTTRPKE
jgi:metal transporter CNNM